MSIESAPYVDLEWRLTELADVDVLEPGEQIQLERARALLENGDEVDRQIALGTIDTLWQKSQLRIQGVADEFNRAEVIGDASTSGVHRTMEAERTATDKTYLTMSKTYRWWQGISILLFVGLAATIVVVAHGNSPFVLACTPMLAIVGLVLAATSFYTARLTQNAREASERMHLRSTLSRWLSTGVALVVGRGDTRLLDRIIALLPHHDSEHSQPLDVRDLQAQVSALERISRQTRADQTRPAEG